MIERCKEASEVSKSEEDCRVNKTESCMHSTGHVKILRSENERSGFEGARVYELLYKAELLLPTPEEAEKGSTSAPPQEATSCTPVIPLTSRQEAMSGTRKCIGACAYL